MQAIGHSGSLPDPVSVTTMALCEGARPCAARTLKSHCFFGYCERHVYQRRDLEAMRFSAGAPRG
jgi:hypothetical protein